MVRHGRLSEDPTKRLSKRNVQHEQLRALTPEESSRLIEATRDNGHHHGMPPPAGTSLQGGHNKGFEVVRATKPEGERFGP